MPSSLRHLGKTKAYILTIMIEVQQSFVIKPTVLSHYGVITSQFDHNHQYVCFLFFPQTTNDEDIKGAAE